VGYNKKPEDGWGGSLVRKRGGWVELGGFPVPETGTAGVGFSLYKILCHFKASLWESIILLLPPST